MIKISLDEAYVFDLLSINQVKITKSIDEVTLKKTRESYAKLRNEIVVQIGVNKFESIIKSQEYLSLVDANEKVFDLVERLDGQMVLRTKWIALTTVDIFIR